MEFNAKNARNRRGQPTDQGGETAIEFLMILTFGVLPLVLAVWLLQDVIQEYVAFGQIFISSPFF